MTMLFIYYPRCSTCQKAKKWLDENGFEYGEQHIVDENPNFDQLNALYEKSGLPLKRFFNTSGKIYREMQLKDKLADMSEEEQLNILSTNGMLVKRPIIENEYGVVLTGFRQKEWEEKLK